MSEIIYSGFFSSGYYIFANGILLIALAAVMHGFDPQLCEHFKIRWLAGAVFATGASRVILTFSLLAQSPTILIFEKGFAVLSLHFYAEYLRQNWFVKNKYNSALLHPLLLILLVYAFYHSESIPAIRIFISLIIGTLVATTGFRAAKELPEEVVDIAKGCFILAIIGYLLNLATINQLHTGWNLFAPEVGISSTDWRHAIPSFFIALMTALAILARHIREKKNWQNKQSDIGFIGHLFFLFAIILLLVCVPFVGNHLEKQNHFRKEVALSQAIERLTQLINHRMLMASHYSAAIAFSPSLVKYLENPDPTNQRLLEHYFTAVSPSNQEGMCYLVGQEGKILVSSNQSDAIKSLDISFRDYFKKAMAGKSSEMIDYGKVTQQLGFYSTHPIFRPSDRKVLGAFTYKSNLIDIKELLKLYHPAMLVDEKGIVFVASDKKYERRQYLHCLSDSPHQHDYNNENATADNQAAPIVRHHTHATARLNMAGWQVVMLPVGNNSNTNTIWIMVTFSLTLLTIILILNSAVIRIRSRKDYEVVQERFQAVFDHAPESMLIISAQNLEILEASHSMTRQFGLTSNVAGISYLSLVPEKRCDIINAWHDPDEKLFKHQRTFVRSNGEIFTAEVTGAPIAFNYQKAIILLLHDITAQKQIEFSLRQAKNAAEEANKLKTRFFANASHEMRTPMSAIIGLTEMALTLSQSQEQKHLLNLARSSGKSLLELVNDVLDLSRIESGKFSIRLGMFDLHQLLKELEELCRFEADKTGLKLEFELADDLPQYIISDGVRLRQVLLNLLNNALKFTESGKVTLKAKTLRDDSDNRLEIRVSDTGRGIPKEIQRHLFAPFTYSDQYTRCEAKGAGLGLAICRQITELLKGRVFVEKTDDTGTTFTLELPFEAVTAKPNVNIETKFHRLTRDKRPLNFLVADDNEINLLLAGAIIEKFGGNHRYARNGKEALEQLTTGNFDVALIDIQMPELDGLSVIKHIRQNNDENCNIPIIAISAFISDQEKQEALQAGANSYLVKPYFPDDLLHAVEELTGIQCDAASAAVIQPERRSDTTAMVTVQSNMKQINAEELEIRILKKPENILKIKDIFERRSVELMTELSACEKNCDCQRLREIIHSIKGLAGMLAAKSTFQLTIELEEHCKNGNVDAALQKLGTLKQQITEIAQDLEFLQQQVIKKTV